MKISVTSTTSNVLLAIGSLIRHPNEGGLFLIARTTHPAHTTPELGNYVSDRVGNYVSVRPLQVGNSVSADMREYFPKGVPITSDPKYLAMVASEINDRPRKIHNWKKPSEIFAELVEANASTA
jgi:hypothetical protein